MRVYVRGQQIRFSAPYSMKEYCQYIPDHRWNKKSQEWTFPAEPEIAWMLKWIFEQVALQTSDDFNGLVREHMAELNRRDINQEWKILDEIPPYPRTKGDPPWEWQRRAFWFIQNLRAAALFMDMGTGKSRVIIDLIANKGYQKVLLIAPNRVVKYDQWPNQFNNYFEGQFTFISLDDRAGSIKDRTETAQSILGMYQGIPMIFAINYEACWREPFKSWSLAQEWDLVVLDESHKIKAAGSKVSLYASQLSYRANQRVILTGTPMRNSPLDVYGQFRFLDKTIFGTNYEQFKQNYAIWGGFENRQVLKYINEDDMNRRIYSLAFRVESDDVQDLPEEQDFVVEYDLSPKLYKHYQELEAEFYTQIDEEEVTASNILSLMLKLQQVTGGFFRGEDGEWVQTDDSKQKALAELLEDMPLQDPLTGRREPIVIFSVFHKDLDNIRQVVEASGRVYGELSGRQDDYAKWVSGDLDAIGIQIQAGGEGLNELVTARYCIYYSTGPDLGMYRQSRKRVHRPGQDRNVFFYHLIARKTIERKIYRSLINKQNVVKAIMEER